MPVERRYAVRYVGEGVRNVEGVGVFQQGTTVHLPAELACKLAEDDDFVFEGNVAPASFVHFRIGQMDPKDRPEPEAARPLADWEEELTELEDDYQQGKDYRDAEE